MDQELKRRKIRNKMKNKEITPRMNAQMIINIVVKEQNKKYNYKEVKNMKEKNIEKKEEIVTKKKFNKKKLALFILPILAIGLVFAGVLAYYGQIQTTIDVTQPIGFFVDGVSNQVGELVEDNVDCNSGLSCLSEKTYKITNGADYPIDVKLVTTGNVSTINTIYVGKLLLENKDGSWNQILGDHIKADLIYSVVGEDFGYNLDAEGLAINTEYALIYYADQPDRFVEWGGNNPGAMIVTATSDSDGSLVVEGSIDLGMNLPHENDANIDGDNYQLEPDLYDYSHGAKIWLVKTSDLPTTYPSEDAWAFWSASGILFETELVWYSDSVDTLTVPANSFIEFTPKYTIDALADGEVDYTITTSVNPVA